MSEHFIELTRRIREAHGGLSVGRIAQGAAQLHEQFNILLIDQKAALEAVPSMLPPDPKARKSVELIHQVLRARGELTAEDNERLKEIARLFGVESGAGKKHLREVGEEPKQKAS